jgi:hypothetical protein
MDTAWEFGGITFAYGDIAFAVTSTAEMRKTDVPVGGEARLAWEWTRVL